MKTIDINTILLRSKFSNANSIAPGRYQNTDENYDRFFVKLDDTGGLSLSYYDAMGDQAIARPAYFCPSYFPTNSKINVCDGSIFDGWFVPTASYIFTVTADAVEVSLVEKNLQFPEYYKSVSVEVGKFIEQIYATNENVALLYSGGIDSVVILSYIIKLGLLNRTKLVYVRNLVSKLSHSSVSNEVAQNAIQQAFDLLRGTAQSIIEIDVVMDDLVAVANDSNYFSFTTYCTSTLTSRFTDTAFITGMYGNVVNMHLRIILNEVILVNDAYSDFTDCISTFGHYSDSLRGIELDDIQLVDRYTHSPRDVAKIAARTNRFYHPLQVGALPIRQLDFSGITVASIFDATVGKQLVRDNVGDMLDPYIIGTTQNEYDSLNTDIRIPVANLDSSVLTVPVSSRHHPEGFDFLTNEVHNAYKNGYIPINSLVSLKLIQYILSHNG